MPGETNDLAELAEAVNFPTKADFGGQTWNLARFTLRDILELDQLKVLSGAVPEGEIGLSRQVNLALVMMRKTKQEITIDDLDAMIDITDKESVDRFFAFARACEAAGFPTKKSAKNDPKASSKPATKKAAGSVQSPS